MSKRPRVLVVEDEPLVAEAIAGVLNEEYRVSTAATVADAVWQLRETDFAAVLLDCLLPDGDTTEIWGRKRVLLAPGRKRDYDQAVARSRQELVRPPRDDARNPVRARARTCISGQLRADMATVG